MEPDLDHIKSRLRELEELEEQEQDPEEDRLARKLLILDGEIRYFLRKHMGVSAGSAADRRGSGLGLISLLAVVFLLLGMWIAVYNPSSDVVEAISGENEQINLQLGEEPRSASDDAVERAVTGESSSSSASSEDDSGAGQDEEVSSPADAR